MHESTTSILTYNEAVFVYELEDMATMPDASGQYGTLVVWTRDRGERTNAMHEVSNLFPVLYNFEHMC